MPDAQRPHLMIAVDFDRLGTLDREFYNREPRKVARDLLGKVILRREKGRVLAGRIVEVEAYLGADDPAAHSAAGKTARNEVLFGPPGHAYVYFIYGNHYCLNVSCEPEGKPGCVLIRALEPLAGIEQMAKLRGLKFDSTPASPRELRLLTSGPGRLCQAMAITRARDNGRDFVTDPTLSIVEDGSRPEKIVSTPRVGITKAAEHAYRYVIADNPFVSAARK